MGATCSRAPLLDPLLELHGFCQLWEREIRNDDCGKNTHKLNHSVNAEIAPNIKEYVLLAWNQCILHDVPMGMPLLQANITQE